VGVRLPWLAAIGGLGGQDGDLGQVVGQDSVSGPDPGAFGAVDHAAVPSVVAFKVTDPAFAAGSPLHSSAERSSSFDVLPGLAGSAFAGNDDVVDAELVQLVLDGGFSVAAVRSHSARFPAGALITRSTAGLSRGASGGLPG
jgi:hypothetical protein